MGYLYERPILQTIKLLLLLNFVSCEVSLENLDYL
jgi:hypothetical protein